MKGTYNVTKNVELRPSQLKYLFLKFEDADERNRHDNEQISPGVSLWQ